MWTGAMEGINQIVTGDLISLAALSAVTHKSYNDGCNGGLIYFAFSVCTLLLRYIQLLNQSKPLAGQTQYYSYLQDT